jgi:hypothetical protein
MKGTVYSTGILVDAIHKGCGRNWQSNGWKTPAAIPWEPGLWRAVMVMSRTMFRGSASRGHSIRIHQPLRQLHRSDQITGKTKKNGTVEMEEAGSGGNGVPEPNERPPKWRI